MGVGGRRNSSKDTCLVKFPDRYRHIGEKAGFRVGASGPRFIVDKNTLPGPHQCAMASCELGRSGRTDDKGSRESSNVRMVNSAGHVAPDLLIGIGPRSSRVLI